MQISWEFFEIANGLTKTSQQTSRCIHLENWTTTDQCFQVEIRRVDVFFSMTFLKTQIPVASIFFRRNFSSILLLLSSKLRLFTNQCSVCVIL